jgi:hypothetical protein
MTLIRNGGLRLRLPALQALPADPSAVASAKAEALAQAGMAQMSAKFKEMGSNVYLDAEKVKESNRVL